MMVYWTEGSVSRVIGLWAGHLRKCGSSLSKGTRFTAFSKCPDWLRGPPIHLVGGYQGGFLQSKVASA